ncbi:MAG: hypothetical protein AAGU27_21880 [Dehalobacterium sp.]
MENKIIDALDALDVKEIDRLLDSQMEMDIDMETRNKIKNLVFEKTGLKKRKKALHISLATASIAIVAVFILLFSVDFNNVIAAIGKIYSFIPGYGIIENNDRIEFVIDGENIYDENDNTIAFLQNAVATKDTICVFLELTQKNFEKDFFKVKQSLKQPTIFLYAGEKQYKSGGMNTVSGSGPTSNTIANFKLAASDINNQTSYRIEYPDYHLSLVFKLKKHDNFDALEEIGPTGYHKNISITAVAIQKDGRLEVNLYPINKSEYRINSFANKPGYLGKELCLQTNKGIKTYTASDGYTSPDSKFYFDVLPDENEFVLKIPYLVVESNEYQNIALKIPPKGEKLVINKEIRFKDSTMRIIDLERLTDKRNEFGSLKMTVRFENRDKNKILCNVDFSRTDFFGTPVSGGYSATVDENDILKTVNFDLEKGNNGTLKLRIENPEYYLLGEYSLTLKQ